MPSSNTNYNINYSPNATPPPPPPPLADTGQTGMAALFRQGLALHQQGELEAAKAIYQQVLQGQPLHFDAVHLLGVIAYQSKDLERAADLMGQAIAIYPRHAPCHSNRGLTLQHLQRLDEALEHYEQALALQPDYAEAYHNRGIALKLMGRLEDALASMDAALALQPDLADCLGNRGMVLQELGRMEEALDSYERALRFVPDSAQAHYNRGTQLERMQRYPEALLCFAEAIARQPRHHEAWTGRGNCHERLGNHQRALASYGQAIAVKPDHALAYYNRGNVLVNLMRHAEAIASYEQAIAIQPDYASAWWNKAINLLVLGRFAEGWPLYEWRWQGDARSLLRDFAEPLWLGAESLAGKTILLHAEQGLGDSIQFCRYAPLLHAQGAQVLLEVPKALVPLLVGLEGVSAVIEKGAELPAFDCHCPLLSLPLACGTQLETIPAPARYLSSASSKRQAWNERLGQKTRPRIGLVWSGNAAHSNDRKRSIALAELLLYLPSGFDYISLQNELRSSDQAALQDSGIRHFVQSIHDFADTAALVDVLDLVISVDTSVAHLCGALGKTTLLLLPYIPDWRWLLERPDSAWYPSLRLLRQGPERQWAPVLQSLAALLQQAISTMSTPSPAPTTETMLPSADDIGRLFNQALGLHQQGQLSQAQSLYQRVLAHQPQHFDALHLLGVIAYQSRNLAQAVALIGQALQIRPLNANAHANLGLALQDLGRRDEALQHYDQALALQPDDAPSHFNRGNLFRQARDLQQALACYQRVVALQPDFWQCHCSLGQVLQDLGQMEQALQSFDRAIALQPNLALAWYSRGLVLDALARHAEALASYEKAIASQPDYALAWHRQGTALKLLGQPEPALASLDAALALKADFPECLDHRGTVLYDLQRMEEALDSYDRALALAPAAAHIHYNRGTVLENLKRHEEALACYQRVVALQPDHGKAWMGVGAAQQELQRYGEAQQSFQRAIALLPDHAPAWFNQGNLLQDMKRYGEAIASYERAIALQPDYASAWWNQSVALLLTGQWERGWALHEWRWKRAPANMLRHFRQPLWLGEPDVAGKTILLYAEQGLGDSIQFCRYAKLVKQRGARVLLQVPAALLALMQEVEGVDQVLEDKQPLPDFDFQCPLLSLPLAFNTRTNSVPAAAGYLQSNPERRRQWQQRLGQRSKPRIGLVWSGNAEHNNDRFRSIPLAELCQHLPAGFDYVSLQKEVRSSDRQALLGSGIRDVSAYLNDFADTAALLDLLDLVICVDTSVAHLAGSLGKTSWLLLPYLADWRWLLERSDTPWYASVTLLRQGPERQWALVLQHMALRLQGLAGAGAAGDEPPVQHSEALFRQGLALHQQGQLAQALAHYEQVLAQQPQHFDALHLRGLIAYQTKNPSLAVERIGQALQINPQVGMAHTHMALALQELGRLDEALVHYQRAAELEPGTAQVYYNLAGAYRASQQLEQAVAACRQCLALQADNALAQHLLGLCLKAQGQPEAALACYERALALQADFAECHCSRGVLLQSLNRLQEALQSYDQAIASGLDIALIHFNRGTLLEKMQRYAESLDSYEQAIARQPQQHEAWTGRGNVLEKLKRSAEALDSFDQALARQPEHAPSWTARGYTLSHLGRHSEAVAHYDRALAIQPDYALAHVNRGHSLAQLLRSAEALDSYDRALALEPGNVGACWNKALALLQTGALEEGWQLYEWGWKEGSRGVLPSFPQALWRGAEDLTGKTLLLYAEQGLGDTLQFCRYASLLHQMGAKVLLEVPRPLVGVLQTLAGVDSVVELGHYQSLSRNQNRSDFDFHCPLLSLPLALKTGLHNIPAQTPYIYSEASKRAFWRKRLGRSKRPRIGLVWSGNADHNNDRNRSIALVQLLAHLPTGFDYVSLHKQVRSSDQAAFKTSRIKDCSAQLDDFSDTAALVDMLDLVISVDTSVAHLSAALGKPTWLLLPYAPDWRWLLERTDSPWYPSMQLFRQSADCQWQPVLQALAQAMLQRWRSA